MKTHLSLFLATMALSAVASAQFQDGAYQLSYAANLNVGDSVLNVSNNGFRSGFLQANPTLGNICANVYVFDPQEEEIGCCSCLVTPNGLNSLSAKSDLISNNLTPAVPTSIVIKLLGSVPGTSTPASTSYTVCNPAAALTGFGAPGPLVGGGEGNNTSDTLQIGLLAWGSTLEPAASLGTYAPVNVGVLNGFLSTSELSALTTVCNFIQANGTGYGICKSCRLGALAGSKQ